MNHIVALQLFLVAFLTQYVPVQHDQTEIEHLRQRIAQLEQQLKRAREALAAVEARVAAESALDLASEPYTVSELQTTMRTQDAMKATRSATVVAQAEKFLAAHATSWQAAFLYGHALTNAKRYPEARDAYRKSLQMAENPYARYGLSLVASSLKEWALAEEDISRALAGDPTNATFRELGSLIKFELAKEKIKNQDYVSGLQLLNLSAQLGSVGDRFAGHRADLVTLCQALERSSLPNFALPVGADNAQMVLEVLAVRRGVNLAMEAIDHDPERTPISDYFRRWAAAYRMGSDYLGIKTRVRNVSSKLLVLSRSSFTLSGESTTFNCSEWIGIKAGVEPGEETTGTLVFVYRPSTQITELEFNNQNPYSSIQLRVPLHPNPP